MEIWQIIAIIGCLAVAGGGIAVLIVRKKKRARGEIR